MNATNEGIVFIVRPRNNAAARLKRRGNGLMGAGSPLGLYTFLVAAKLMRKLCRVRSLNVFNFEMLIECEWEAVNHVSQAVNDWGLFSVLSSDAAGRVEDPHLRRRAFEAQRPGRMISVNRSANDLQGLHLLCNASPECD